MTRISNQSISICICLFFSLNHIYWKRGKKIIYILLFFFFLCANHKNRGHGCQWIMSPLGISMRCAFLAFDLTVDGGRAQKIYHRAKKWHLVICDMCIVQSIVMNAVIMWDGLFSSSPSRWILPLTFRFQSISLLSEGHSGNGLECSDVRW